jgi:protein-disulfide isomerase
MPPKPRKPPPRRPGTRNKNLLLAGAGAAVVVVVLIVVSVVLAGRGGGSGTTATGSTGDAALIDGIPQQDDVLGAESAKVTMIQVEDLQCPICRAYQEEGFPDIVKEYVRPGKVKLRFVGIPIIGADSEKALFYVLAAGKQGKLWQYASALYANQGAENSGWVTEDLLHQLADDLGLDWQQLMTDASSTAVKQQAEKMAAEAAQRQVPGTPTFFIQIGNQAPYVVQPSSFSIESFRPIFDDALGQ